MKEKQIEEMANDIDSIVNEVQEGCNYTDCEECKYLEIGCKCKAVAKRLYNAGYRKQEWISVEDRLPTKSHERYLVYTELGIVDFDIYSAIGGWQGNSYVTHWMPLPQPPQMKGAE